MLRVQLFGELVVLRDGRRDGGAPPSPVAQALLVMLACHGEAGVSRSRLAQLLPSLNGQTGDPLVSDEALLGEWLGAGYLMRQGDALALDPGRVQTDVTEFRAMLASGQLEQAVQVHAARLVDGFHHRQAPSFERWLQTQRDAFASDRAAALERLAVTATERGELLAAVRWWRMLAAQYPLNDRIAASLMEALVLAGDRDGAIRHARYHEALVAERLDLPEDAQVLALAQAIRRSEWPPPRGGTRGSPAAALLAAPVAEAYESSPVERFRAAVADRYAIEREIGRGGYGLVLLAHDLRHHRPVAIKVMHPEIRSGSSGDRFLREIRLISSLQHPNILPLFDSGSAAGLLYYVMPFIDGESLRQRLRRDSRLPLEEAVRIAHQVATALDAAHRRGVVHRDIKPENLLLADGQVMVADFGIACSSDAASSEQLTETGVAVGTPAYMSPEQADGSAHTDGRSDIYSLGCVLFEMLTGAPPYGTGAVAVIMMRHIHDPVPSTATHRRDVPVRLDWVVRRAMAKTPGERFAAAGEFAYNLAEALRDIENAGAPRPEPKPPRTTGSTRLFALLAALVLIALALAAVLPRTPIERSPAAPERTSTLKENVP